MTDDRCQRTEDRGQNRKRVGSWIEFGPPWCELRLYATYIETQHNDVDLKYHVQTVWAREVGPVVVP
jgi:hypothetical protein